MNVKHVFGMLFAVLPIAVILILAARDLGYKRFLQFVAIVLSIIATAGLAAFLFAS